MMLLPIVSSLNFKLAVDYFSCLSLCLKSAFLLVTIVANWMMNKDGKYKQRLTSDVRFFHDKQLAYLFSILAMLGYCKYCIRTLNVYQIFAEIFYFRLSLYDSKVFQELLAIHFQPETWKRERQMKGYARHRSWSRLIDANRKGDG